MKFFYFFIILLLFHHCSFDNKTGIWNSQDVNTKNNNILFKDFKKLYSDDQNFNQIINLDKKFTFKVNNAQRNSNWNDIFFSSTNNFVNFKYNNKNEITFISKKLTNSSSNEHILFEKGNLILTDTKGNIIIFSLKENKIISKFNFYKNNFKKIKKKLNIVVEKNIVYVSDNIGYLYAYDYRKDKIIWAKNYKIPFRSNIKLINDKIIASTQNNNLYFFYKKNGDTIKMLPTEEITVKNQFVNNLAFVDNSLFFINTYGTLYSIDTNTMKVKWFLNLNQSIDLNPSNLFFGTVIVQHNNKIVISGNQSTYIIDSNTGRLLSKKNFFLKTKPVILNNYLFLVTNNNLLISINLNNFKILYSQDINQKVANFLDIKKKEVKIKNIMLSNKKIFLFLENSFLLVFNINGNIEEIRKLSAKIISQPIFINGSILFIDKKNRLVVLD